MIGTEFKKILAGSKQKINNLKKKMRKKINIEININRTYSLSSAHSLCYLNLIFHSEHDSFSMSINQELHV